MWWFVSMIYAQFLWLNEYAWKAFELLKKGDQLLLAQLLVQALK